MKKKPLSGHATTFWKDLKNIFWLQILFLDYKPQKISQKIIQKIVRESSKTADNIQPNNLQDISHKNYSQNLF